MEKDKVDINNYPSLKMSKSDDVFGLDIIEKYRKDSFDTYYFNGLPVPRVSEIIKKCINKEYLIWWAARVGSKNMMTIQNKATYVGTLAHRKIEHYILTGEEDFKLSTFDESIIRQVNTSFKNFKLWLQRLNNAGYKLEKVIATELSVVCPYYGGTIDLVAQINGAIYIIDYKTSTKITYEYILQVCAYMWMINNGYSIKVPHVNGIGIVRIDKNKYGVHDDYFLNEFIPCQKQILDYNINAFISMVYSYYNLINAELQFDQYNERYDFFKVIEKGCVIEDD